MAATAKSLPQNDGDPGGAEEAMTPLATIRQAFNCSIREYCDKRTPGSSAENRSTFLGRISDFSSYEHKWNFFLFCFVLNLRELLHAPAAQATMAEPKIKTDLAILLATKEWSLMFLRKTAEDGNIPAGAIWQTLSCLGLLRNGRGTEDDTLDLVPGNKLFSGKSPKDKDSGKEKNMSATSLTGDILVELRLRIRKGCLWRDDPWWPKASKEEGEGEQE